jgi:hypothetical protein
MEVANYSFEAVRDSLLRMEGKWNEQAPEHYLTMVGLICVYARPFTNNDPVGKLSEEEIIPTQFKELHDEIMSLRYKLFAHADASYVVGKNDYPNEVVIEHDGVTPQMTVSRPLVKPAELEEVVPLC